MKLRFIKYCIFILINILLIGCEKDVKTVDLPLFKQMLAIASFISPSDSVSYVFVSSNQRLYGELNEENTGNISGTISDGSNEVSLDTVQNGLIFSREKMQIQYGKTYTLKLISDIGLSAEAYCSVPGKKEFNMSVDTFFVELNNVQINDSIFHVYCLNVFTISFSDFQGEDNFYRLTGNITTYKTNPGTGEIYQSKGKIYMDKEFYTDNGMDGKRISLSERSGGYSTFSIEDSAFLTMYLFNTEKSYYMYHTSLENYNSDENPFSEVTPVYSNIKGGLGIFTSYTVDSVVYRIK